MQASLQLASGLLFVRIPYRPAIVDALREIPTAKWQKARKAWSYRPTPAVAQALREMFVKFGLTPVGDVSALAAQQREESTDTLEMIVDPKPWEHQTRGVHLIGKNFATYINGGMGVGKSRMVVDAVVNYRFARTLIVCPSSVVAVWPREFAKYAAHPVKVVALQRGTLPKRTEAARLALEVADARGSGEQVVIAVNYEAIWRKPFAELVLSRDWDLVAYDEIHRIKSATGKQSKFCAQLRDRAKHAVGLSGTPMPHGPADLFAQFRALDSGIYGESLTRFKLRYIADMNFRLSDKPVMPDMCKLALQQDIDFAEVFNGERSFKADFAKDLSLAQRCMAYNMNDQQVIDVLVLSGLKTSKRAASRGHYVAVMSQAKKLRGYPVNTFSNLEDLKAKMDTIALSVSRDVLDLPEAMDVHRYVVLSDKERKAHSELWNDLCTYVKTERVSASNALTRLLKVQQAVCGFAKTEAGNLVQIGDSRRKALTETLEDIGVGGGEPAVVFCRFHADLDAVHHAATALGAASAELSGRTNELAAWQEPDGPPVLAVQIQSGGVGVDLTRSCYSIFYSLGYSLGDYEQAKARTHRPGQKHKVTHVHIIADGTVDDHVYKALKAKRDVVSFVLERIGKEKPDAK